MKIFIIYIKNIYKTGIKNNWRVVNIPVVTSIFAEHKIGCFGELQVCIVFHVYIATSLLASI